jgi:NAD(P)-dependent dehydrogenase (short-subunit alcohol dehydrogenase family)
VTLGGTLHQHLPDVLGSEKSACPRGVRSGEVTVEPETRLRRLLGEVGDQLTVHAYHHQAVDRVAGSLTVSARSEDGIVEALELASKGGVLAMTRELGVQFARQGTRVNALCPGPVNTPLLQEVRGPGARSAPPGARPVGRFAEPEELAAAVAFLASDDASFITASTFLVDGGISSGYVTPL